MTKNLERTKIKAILKTLKEQYPEQFVPALEEFMDESKATVVVANLEENEELEYFIRKNFDRYAEVFKALA
jgi:molybdopterin converting factor small subunit